MPRSAMLIRMGLAQLGSSCARFLLPARRETSLALINMELHVFKN